MYVVCVGTFAFFWLFFVFGGGVSLWCDCLTMLLVHVLAESLKEVLQNIAIEILPEVVKYKISVSRSDMRLQTKGFFNPPFLNQT